MKVLRTSGTVDDKRIIDAVEAATGIQNIRLDTRKREYVDARRIAYKIFRATKMYSYSKIGSLFDKDHATILFGIKTAENLLDTEPSFKHNYLEALSVIGGLEGRKARIMERINQLKKELLTIEKKENGIQL